MTGTFSVLWTALIAYTAYCAAYGPPYHDAYGAIVHAAWTMINH